MPVYNFCGLEKTDKVGQLRWFLLEAASPNKVSFELQVKSQQLTKSASAAGFF